MIKDPFATWFYKVAQPKMTEFIKEYLKNNPDYTEDDIADRSDSGCVRTMIHEGETENMLWDTCETIFGKGYLGEEWEMSMGDSLFCELDSIIEMSYLAGKKAGGKE